MFSYIFVFLVGAGLLADRLTDKDTDGCGEPSLPNMDIDIL